MIEWVIFDVGETLFCEERLWNGWADYLGVSRNEFQVALLDCIRSGKHHREVFQAFDPQFDLAAARNERSKRGDPDKLHTNDLYPDALSSIRALSLAGINVGVAGNQPVATSRIIGELDAPIDLIGMSEEWAVQKPDPAFFRKLIDFTDAEPGAIAYVGDRIDNDVLPAVAAGMMAIQIKRGPWAQAQVGRIEEKPVFYTVGGLDEILPLVRNN